MVVDVVVDGDAQSKNAAKKLAAKAEKLAKVKVQYRYREIYNYLFICRKPNINQLVLKLPEILKRAQKIVQSGNMDIKK